MDKLKMKSKDLTNENIERIGELFPNVITEIKDENGKTKKAIDFELLQQELSEEIVDGSKERYKMTWPGKKEAIVTANTPINKTLRPVIEDSLNWEDTENLYIEGDNLEVLKLLQESYLNKVKCIYIDPPYNTGNDFIYKDNFAQDRDEYAQESGQVDEEGNRLFQNTEYNGRYHSDWLTMMYPRLKLARNLLSEDGVIFISIDDNEVHNLRKICDEIFGERNFVSAIAWRRNDNQSNIGNIAKVKEYVVCYCKNYSMYSLNKLPLSDKAKNEYRYEDEKGKFRRSIILHKTRGRHYYNVKTPGGKVLNGPWMIKEKEFWELDKKNGIYWTSGGEEQPYGKIYLHESKGQIPNDFWGIEFGTNQRASLEVESLFQKRLFDFPKPVSLIRSICMIGTNKDSIILDFFSGSATTAHAVMDLNSEDGGNRKYIMVQLPEPCDEKSEAYKAGYKNIAEIGKERIRRAGKKIKEETDADIDYGFRVYKVDSSNMKDIYYRPDELEQNMLDQLESNIKEDRTNLDLLTQVMLEAGLELSLPIDTKEIQGKEVHFVAGNSLVACFDENVDEELIKEISKVEPLKVVFRDNSFKSCPDKINLEEIFKGLSPSTDIMVL